MMRSFGCLGFVCILCGGQVASGQEPASRTITTTGSYTLRLPADGVRITFRVRSSENTAGEARDANQKAVKLADEKLSALKIKDLKVSYAPASLSQQTERMVRAGGAIGGPAGGGRVIENVHSFISVKAGTVSVNETDKDKLADAIDKIEKALVDSGVVSFGAAGDDDLPPRLLLQNGILPSGLTVTLVRNDDSTFRDEALTKAVQDAQRKARALAVGAGVRIKETVSIVENEVYFQDVGLRSARSATGVAASTTSGELELTVRVTVKCSY